MKYLNKNIEWALSPQAISALNELTAIGIDRDLALSLIEQLVPETSIYEIPDEDNHG